MQTMSFATDFNKPLKLCTVSSYVQYAKQHGKNQEWLFAWNEYLYFQRRAIVYSDAVFFLSKKMSSLVIKAEYLDFMDLFKIILF